MRKKLSIPKDSFVIGYVGNDPSRRGALECIRVLNVIQEVDNRPLYVLIVGPNDTMMSSHISHSIIERVIFVDSISYFDVPAYMDVIDVGFSILPPHHRGASEQKVRQYMALGIPAIVTPGGSSFVSDAKAGIIIENGYIEEILEALGTISNDYSFYSNNAQRYAQMNLDSKDLSLERMKIIELCKN
jgi:glycosyltransferase involved in cell wall biosynthesis